MNIMEGVLIKYLKESVNFIPTEELQKAKKIIDNELTVRRCF